MKTLITTLNSKYIHKSLAVRLLYVATKDYHDIDFKEYTIKDDLEHIVTDILSLKIDVLAISVYIWNVALVKQLITRLKQLAPELIIIVGGPEVSYEIDYFLDNFAIDYLISGEGEVVFKELLDCLKENKPGAKRVAIELDVPDDEIIKRVVNRLICTNKSCGAIYNKETKPPKKDGICDICGGELKKRDDDNVETVTKRLGIYHQNSKDLIDFYRKNNALYSIYPKDLDIAVKDIKNFLDEYRKKQ